MQSYLDLDLSKRHQRRWFIRPDSGLCYCHMRFCRLELGLLPFMASDSHIQLAAKHDPDPRIVLDHFANAHAEFYTGK